MARRCWSPGRALVLAAMLAACVRPGAEAPDVERPLQLRFEDSPAPGAFRLDATAVRDRGDGAAGLWAVVAGLSRPERARIVNLETGSEVVVALFSGPRGAPIRLSNEAADALGIERGPAPVQVTALRSRPSIDTTGGRF